METQNSFGYWLRLKRKAMDLTREGLAQQVGCSAALIRKIEAEERRPSAQIVRRLAQVFNIPESEHTTFLRFSRGDWLSLPAESGEAEPWLITRGQTRSNIPAPTTSLIGREIDIANVWAYLSTRDVRLVTLVGPPGIGKTRLSLEVARESLDFFPEGVFFVPLAPLDDSELIPTTIRETLGFIEIKSQSQMERIKESIGHQRILLVLDNAEHLIEAVAGLTTDLLLACPRLKILVTSREALRVYGEWLYAVPVLNTPHKTFLPNQDEQTAYHFAAVRLFVERARAVQPDFTLNTDNLTAVAGLCTQLDGLPLAIELFAARIRLMSPQQLIARMTAEFTLHSDGQRGRPPHQKTLSDAIGWSYALLSEKEQGLFSSLSIFAGGFSLNAAEKIFGEAAKGPAVADLILTLLDKSLLQRSFDARGQVRFIMLVTIQQFGTEMLGKWGWSDAMREKHLAYFLELVEKTDQEIHGPDQVDWSELLEIEHNNFWAALEYCVAEEKTEVAVRLLGGLAWPWRMRGHGHEMISWFGKVRSLPGIAAYQSQHARLLNETGVHHWLMGDYSSARDTLEESQAILLGAGSNCEQELAEILISLGSVLRAINWKSGAAASLFEQGLEIHKKYGNQRGMARVMLWLGWTEVDRNETAAAIALYEQSLKIYQRLGDLWGIGRISQLLGQVFLEQGEYAKAHPFLNQHLKIDESLHFQKGVVVALNNLGDLCRLQGDNEQARSFYERILTISREAGLRLEHNEAYYFLGILALHQNDYARARQNFLFCYAPKEIRTDKIATCDILIALAAIAAGIHQPERAARLSGAIQAILDIGAGHIPPFDRAEFERHIRTAREGIGGPAFERLVADGCTRKTEQAVAYALEGVELPLGSFLH